MRRSKPSGDSPPAMGRDESLGRWGFLGGSFDPIHLGHLWIATFAREQLALDQVLLVPAAAPPHKGDASVAPFAFRFDLVCRAVRGRPGLVASDLEADAARPSYTVESLRLLRGRLAPQDEIWLLIGGDSLHELPSWREPDEILRLANLGIYDRPGHPCAAPAGARVRWIDGPACGLSSTLIRERLRHGLSVDGLVPSGILELLESSDLYRRG